MNYNNYKAEDFVLDPEFRNWILRPDTSSNLFWEKWIAAHPEKLDAVKTASEILLALGTVDYQAPAGMEDEIWQDIDQKIGARQSTDTQVVPLNPSSILNRYAETRPKSFKWIYSGVAASLLVASTLIVYFLGGIDQDRFYTAVEETITKENPKGQKSTIMLSDGTKIILNSESKLEYTSQYNQEERRVILTGEAFFEVARDDKRPFIVETSSFSTTALGTSFNIHAYPGEQEVVTLHTGKVSVKMAEDPSIEAILIPGEKVVLSENNDLVKTTFDMETEALWKNGILYFQDTPFSEGISTLERWYGVDIEVNDLYENNLSFTGRFENDYLSNVLGSLSYTMDFSYQITEEKVIINFKRTDL